MTDQSKRMLMYYANTELRSRKDSLRDLPERTPVDERQDYVDDVANMEKAVSELSAVQTQESQHD